MTDHTTGNLARGRLFWCGTALATAGVGLHVPMFVAAAPMGFRMAGMPTPPDMLAGMALIVVGLLVAAWGLCPRTAPAQGPERYVVAIPPDARLRPVHRKLVIALFVAMVVDQMKPATLAFIEPGMRVEYGVSATTVATLPVVALTGTVVGSLAWGRLADRFGRRAAILLATLMFISTTICGTMPTFGWNLVMCLLMGMSAGGMLPITYTLLAETFPARRRGVIMVSLAGLTTVVGYLACSGLAALFLPIWGWRSLWFVQLPLALLLIAFNRWIPESPGFLAMRKQYERARAIAAELGGALVPAERRTPDDGRGFGVLFTTAYRSQTLVIGLYSLSWGLIYWGFMTFLPSLLRGAGSAGAELLSLSALLALPGTAVVAVFYRVGGSRRTMVLYGGLTALALFMLGVVRASGGWVTLVALILLLTGTSGTLAVIGPYAAEVYPTSSRGVASGVAAGFGKAGGVVGPLLVSSLLAAFPGVWVAAFAVAVPMALATVTVGLRGLDTRQPSQREHGIETWVTADVAEGGPR